jgi:hypothetical protein
MGPSDPQAAISRYIGHARHASEISGAVETPADMA